MTTSTASNTQQMRAVVLHGPRDLRAEFRPRPHPGPGEVLVRVHMVGVCGSDIHFFEEGRAGSSIVRDPVVLGHEFGGEIAAVGPGTNREVGQRVSIEPGIQCGRCEACIRGTYNHCTNMRFLGAAPTDGALQEYVIVPADHAHPVPDSVSDDAAALIEPLSVAIWGVSRARLQDGESVLIIGAGPIGVLCALVAQTHNPRQIVIADPSEGRRSRAASITAAMPVLPDDLRDRVPAFDVVFECSGSRSGLDAAMSAVHEAGRVVLLGVGVDRLDIPMNLLQEGEVTVTGSHRYRDTWPAAISMIARNTLDPVRIVTAHYTLDRAEEAILAPRTDPTALKVCIDVRR